MLAYYLHNLNEIALDLPGSLDVRWYGIAYVLGFIGGYYVLMSLAKRGYSELRPPQVGDLITYTALFGVMLGGRLGYMLLYNFDEFISNPLIFFKLRQGGMASHGGIAGIVLFTLWYARRHKLSWPGIGDNLVVGAPIGLFCGRMANFINGELFGRSTTVPWACQFPSELENPEQVANLKLIPPEQTTILFQNPLDPANEALLRQVLTPRHPSQIYQALLEGLLLFLILLIVRIKFKNLSHGILTGIFFIGYAILRIVGEFFREPDFGSSYVIGLTKGQFYSTFMILIGAAFIAYGCIVKRKNRPPQKLASADGNS